VFDLEHGDKAREPLRQQIDPAPTRKAPSLGIMHRHAPIQQADVGCNRSKIAIAASQLSLCEPNTLAMILGEAL
jgi:hypothetical protein